MDAHDRPEIYLFGAFCLDRRGGGLFRRGDGGSLVHVSIGSRALDVLGVLVEQHGDLVSKDEIMAAVWPSTVVEEANLTVQVSTLRRVLDPAGEAASCIQTVPGRGYRFTAAVTRQAADGREPEPRVAETAPPTPGAVGDALMRRRRAAAVLLLVGLAAAGWAASWVVPHRWLHRDTARRMSIVVLPFANLNNDPEQAYFAEAITDDLTTDLSRIAGSVVIAHSTALSYRDSPVDVMRIGHDLDVRYVLEGSVRRLGDQVEVNAQLIDAESGTHVWADRFETDRRNLAAAQSAITGRLAHTLDVELVGDAGRRIERERAANLDASDLVMRGWDLWIKPFSVENRAQAARFFERARELDPQSLDARVGIATILAANLGTGTSRSPQEDSARAEKLLVEAIEQDPNDSRAHEVLGTLSRIENRLDESRVEFAKAVALDRNNAHALLGLGETLMFMGRPAEGVPLIENSIRLDPRDPNAAFGDWALGSCHLLLGQVDEATDLLRRARDGNPRVYFFHLYLAGALGLKGDIDEARAAVAQAIRLKPEVASLAAWRTAQPWLGNPAFVALSDKTLDAGLRRAGMPAE